MKNPYFLLVLILFPFILSAQTNKTWTGSTSTNWRTASNWSPSGVPASTDNITIPNVTNDPIIDTTLSAGTLTLTSGASLNIGTFTFTTSGLVSLNTATLSNGKLVSNGGLSAINSTVDVLLTTSGNTVTLTGSTFKETSYISKTGSTSMFCGGNTFEKPLHLATSATANIYFGYSNPDTFKDSVLSSVGSSSVIYFAYSSVNNVFEGFTRLERTSSATSNGFIFCSGNSSASVVFQSDVELGSASGTTQIGLEFTRNTTFQSGASIKNSAMGWAGCKLNLNSVTVSDSVLLNLTGNGALSMLGTSTFSAPVNITAPSIFLGNLTFNNTLSLTKTGSSSDGSNESLICNGAVTINNTGTGYFLLNGSSSESFASTLTVNNSSVGQIDIARYGQSTFNGKLTLTNSSTGSIAIGNLATTKATLNADLEINSSGGLIILGLLEHISSKKLEVPTFTGGNLYFKNYLYNQTDSLIISGSSTARFTLVNCEMHAPFKVTVPSIVSNGGTFYDDVFLTKTGTNTESCSGAMTFHKKAHFKTTGTGSWQINYAGTVCTYYDDFIIESTGTGNICPGYAGYHNLHKNFELRGSTTPNMNFGSNMSFVGNTNQHILSTGSLSSITMVRMTVNKPVGELILDIPTAVSYQMSLTKGNVIASSSANLTAAPNIVGGSDSSYVEGPMIKTGTAAYTFPLGGGGQYAPISIEAVSSSTTFKASYIGTDPNSSYSRSSKDASLGFVNRCGYWKLERTTGTGTTKANLGWSNNPCFSSNPIDSKVAIWDGSQWKDKGNGAYLGNSTTGNVQSSTSLTSFPAILDLTGVCGLTAGLSANRDTLYSGYLATFTATPSSQSNYKFYVNNVLKQDSSNAHFKTHTLVNGDSVKVKVKNVDGCEDIYIKVIQVINAPNIIEPQLNDTLALFAGDSIVVDTIAWVFGDVRAIQSISNGIANIWGDTISGSSLYNTNFANDLDSIYNEYSYSGGWYTQSDTIQSFTLSGQYHFNEDQLFTGISFEGDSTSVYIINVQDKLSFKSTSQVVQGNVNPKNIFWICSEFENESGAEILGTVICNNAIVRPINGIGISVFAKTNIFIKDVNIRSGNFLIMRGKMDDKSRVGEELNCCTTPLDQCNIVCNGHFEYTTEPYSGAIPLVGGLVDWADCWTRTSGGTQPAADIFMSSQPLGLCEFPTTLSSIGIPDNFNGQDVPPSNTYLATTFPNTNYAGFAKTYAMTKLTQVLNPQYKYILDFSIHAKNCNPEEPWNNNGQIALSLVNPDVSNGLPGQFIQSQEMEAYYDGEFMQTQVGNNYWFRRIFCLDGIEDMDQYTHIYVQGFSNSDEVYIDDIRIYRLADAGENKQICLGETVTIGPTCSIPGAAYSWSPSNGILGNPCGVPNCPQIYVSPSNTTTYTLTVQSPEDDQVAYHEFDSGADPGNVCIATDQVLVTVNQIPNIIISAPIAACGEGEICIANPESNTTYTWSAPNGTTLSNTEGNCTTIDWNNIPSGIVGVSAINQFGCVNASSVNIPSCCQGSLATLLSPNVSDWIEWLNGPTQPTVKPEFQSWVSITPFGSSNFTSSLSSIEAIISTSGAGTLSFVGDLTIDVGKLRIDNSELIFSHCSKIQFLGDGATPNLLFIKASYLHSCDDKLWGGVELDGLQNEDLIIYNSRVEDAVQAIYVRREANVIVHDNVFNKNVIHMDLRNSPNMSNSQIYKNRFLCNAGSNPVYGGAPAFRNRTTQCEDPDAPFYPYITNYGIKLRNVSGLLLEDNLFEHAYAGIFSFQSNFEAVSDTFSKMYRYLDPLNTIDVNALINDPTGNYTSFNGNTIPEAGSGIYYSNSYRLSTGPYTGGYLRILSNEFTDVYGGVKIENSALSVFGKNGTTKTDVQIQANHFDNSVYTSGPYGDFAVNASGITSSANSNNFFQDIDIILNNVESTSSGIMLKNCNSELTIERNSIDFGNNLSPVRPMRKAISVQNHLSYIIQNISTGWGTFPIVRTALYDIKQNYIGNNSSTSSIYSLNPTLGIEVNLSSYGNIEGNLIYTRHINNPLYGIASIASSNVRITENDIYKSQGSLGSNYQNLVGGIYIADSKLNTVCNNLMQDFASGLIILNQSNSLKTKCNSFTNNRFNGVYLKDANFGHQGSNTFPSDNFWYDNIGTNYKRIRGNLSFNTHVWYYRSGASTELANPSFVSVSPSGYFFPALVSSPPSLNCNNSDVCLLVPSIGSIKLASERDTLFGRVVSSIDPDTISNSISYERYSEIRGVYETFRMDSTWLNIENSTDSLYELFYNKCFSLPMGEQYEILNGYNTINNDSLMVDSLNLLFNGNDSLISESIHNIEMERINKLNTQNTRLTPVHPSEAITKQAIAVIGRTWAKGIYSLNSSDSISLNSIAFSNPMFAGEGVYIARMLLDTIVNDVESELRISNKNEVLTTNYSISLFPNPTQNIFQIRAEGDSLLPISISLFDISGRKILNYFQNNPLESHYIGNLAEGVYLYEINNHTGLLHRGKLMINNP